MRKYGDKLCLKIRFMCLLIGAESLQTCSLMRAKSIDDSFNAEFTRNVFFFLHI